MGLGVGGEVAGYRLRRVIGEGGMSIVYLAERVLDGEQVALKILREELFGDRDFRRRFVRESRYAASLDHPNVVKVLDAGETEETSYIAMEYVDGSDLYALLEHGPLEPAAAVAILAQVAAALDAAHAIGLLHRDVKPGNVLTTSTDRTRAPRCLLADFGLGKHTTRDSVALTAAGTFVGTLAYTAPEQMIGPEPGAAADIYSLGCLLFECLEGRPPFVGTELEVMQAHIESEPPKLSGKGSPFPPRLDAVIRRAMAKEPADRHPSGAELVAAAAEALNVKAPAVVPPVAEAAIHGRLGLLVISGSAVGTTLQVDDELVIGRGEPGQGSLGEDLAISRRHARIARGPGGILMIEDLGSTNGSFLNGRQTMGLEIIRPDDELELGSTKLLAFVAPEELQAVVAADQHSQPARGPATAAPATPSRDPHPALSPVAVRLQLLARPEEGSLSLGERSGGIKLVHDGRRWRFEPA